MIARAIILLVLAAAIIAAVARGAPAHSWYEPRCCSGSDCGPAPEGTTLTSTPGGVEAVVPGVGKIEFTREMERASQDADVHLCFDRVPRADGFAPVAHCIYLPAGA